MFTRVLKGHIAIDNCVYPAGTAGCMLDSFARQYLWEIGKDYLHGKLTVIIKCLEFNYIESFA